MTREPPTARERPAPATPAASLPLSLLLTLCAFAGCLLAGPAPARVLAVRITSSWDVPPLGDGVPAYVAEVGRITFGVDPALPANARIVDLELAPLDDDGLVRAEGDFMILRPRDSGDSSRTCLVEVSNRGGKALLRYFNAGDRGSLAPGNAGAFGDGLLMQLGLTLVWVGWQADVPREPGRLRLDVPVASEDGRPIRGLVRADWVVDQRVDRLPLGHRDHVAYAPVAPDDVRNVLTRRSAPDAPRRVVPRNEWSFGTGQEIRARTVFEPGWIYELVYLARDPRLVGLGLAAVRDTASWLKYGDPEGAVAGGGGLDRCIAFGVSQTGRFLRHFLYQGFNEDEAGRRAYDGMLVHSAGAGRGSFNHRFAQPSRDAHRYSSFDYPTDLYPFTSRTVPDPVTGGEDGLLAAYEDASLLPRVIYTNSGYEYYGRAASLIHTSPDGERDVEPLPGERIFLLAGGQHFVDGWPPPGAPTAPASRGNPLDYLVNLRALMVALVEWVKDDVEPPASLYPRLAGGSLTPLRGLEFPYVPGVLRPQVAYQPHRLNYGRQWDEGIALRQPPTIGEPYPVFVPQVDRFGNEFAGIRNVEIQVPLATYTPWSYRDGLANPSELTDFLGLFIPLPLSAEEAERAGDERPAIADLYPGREAFASRPTRRGATATASPIRPS